MTSRSPGNAALTASRRAAAYGATSARSGEAVGRGAHPDRTNARNSSVVGLLRFSLFFCSSLTGPSSHSARRGDDQGLANRPAARVRPDELGDPARRDVVADEAVPVGRAPGTAEIEGATDRRVRDQADGRPRDRDRRDPAVVEDRAERGRAEVVELDD